MENRRAERADNIRGARLDASPRAVQGSDGIWDDVLTFFFVFIEWNGMHPEDHRRRHMRRGAAFARALPVWTTSHMVGVLLLTIVLSE